MKTEIAKTTESNIMVSESQSPMAIMSAAIEKGLDLDKVDKMLDINAKYEAMQAKKAYVQAMASFKANPPKIFKDSHVGYTSKRTGGATDYAHATLGNVTEKINKSLADHGLSASWKTLQGEKDITVTCIITHNMGHSEQTSLTAQPDTSGNKNSIQAIGSTITYLQRYTILALTGLATHEDDDGHAAGLEFLTPDQVKTVTSLIKAKAVDVNEVLAFAKAETVDTITQNTYKPLISKLKATPVVKK